MSWFNKQRLTDFIWWITSLSSVKPRIMWVDFLFLRVMMSQYQKHLRNSCWIQWILLHAVDASIYNRPHFSCFFFTKTCFQRWTGEIWHKVRCTAAMHYSSAPLLCKKSTFSHLSAFQFAGWGLPMTYSHTWEASAESSPLTLLHFFNCY